MGPKITHMTDKVSAHLKIYTCITNGAEIFAYASKLLRGHVHNSLVCSLRNSKVLAVNIHQFHLKV